MHGLAIRTRAAALAVAALAAATLRAGGPQTAAARTTDIDGVAATVGSDTILKSEVLAEMARAGATDALAYPVFVRRLAERALILKAAKAAKTTMQDWVVDDRVRSIAANAFGGDRNKLVEALARDGLSFEDWRNRIKNDLIVAAMKWNEVDKYAQASPAAMRREYDEHPERYRSESLMTLGVILLKPADAAKTEEISAALAEAKAKGSKEFDAAFAKMAKAYSADVRAKNGGVWNDVKPEEVFKPEICAVAAALRPGELSQWGDIDGWKFVVRKISESGDARKTFEQAYEDVERNVRDEESARLYREWIERLEADTPITIR